MKRITLVTGGSRSGKSSYALKLAQGYGRKAFIATAVPCDDEMRERIAQHRCKRAPSFLVVEEPLELAGALQKLSDAVDLAVIDCLAVWIGNLMHHHATKEISSIKRFIEQLKNPPCDLIIVTNEVGMGIVPDNEPSRRYRDILGALNQRIAALAHQVVLMVGGVPVYIKTRTIKRREG
jgi:adenosylcobinamide kinase/adenosylcobinamide-phosphate guanylyltransferase